MDLFKFEAYFKGFKFEIPFTYSEEEDGSFKERVEAVVGFYETAGFEPAGQVRVLTANGVPDPDAGWVCPAHGTEKLKSALGGVRCTKTTSGTAPSWAHSAWKGRDGKDMFTCSQGSPTFIAKNAEAAAKK